MYLLLTYLFVYPNFDLIYPDDECTFYDFIIDLKEINSIFSTYLCKQFIITIYIVLFRNLLTVKAAEDRILQECE